MDNIILLANKIKESEDFNIKLKYASDLKHLAENIYLNMLQRTYYPLFIELTKDKIMNKDSIIYKLYFPNINTDNDTATDTSFSSSIHRTMYKKLLLKIHPDKNIDRVDKANLATSTLLKYKDDKHIHTIEYYHDNIDNDIIEIILKGDTNMDIDIDIDIETLNNNIKRSYWYLYHFDPYFKSLYINNNSPF